MPSLGKKLQGKKNKPQQGKRVHVNKYASGVAHEKKAGSNYREKQAIPLEIRLREGRLQRIMQQKSISRQAALDILRKEELLEKQRTEEEERTRKEKERKQRNSLWDWR